MAAEVVCREVGCGSALSAPIEATFGQGEGQIWIDDVTCVGTEASLSLCQVTAWGSHNCGHREDAGVECLGKSNFFPIRAGIHAFKTFVIYFYFHFSIFYFLFLVKEWVETRTEEL